MRTTRGLGALAPLIALGCADAPHRGPGCEAYAEAPAVRAHCLEVQAQQLPAAQAAAMCDTLTDAQARACRTAWVETSPRRTGLGADELLGMCGTSADCAFYVLEQRPADSVDEQLRLCGERAGRFRNDCYGHALQRWQLGQPDDAEISRLGEAYGGQLPEVYGQWVGVVRWCQGRRLHAEAPLADALAAGCPTGTRSAEACRRSLLTADAQRPRCAGHAAPLK